MKLYSCPMLLLLQKLNANLDKDKMLVNKKNLLFRKSIISLVFFVKIASETVLLLLCFIFTCIFTGNIHLVTLKLAEICTV